MFFHRNQRIRTEPRIPGELEEEPNNKRRIKIKKSKTDNFEFDTTTPRACIMMHMQGNDGLQPILGRF